MIKTVNTKIFFLYMLFLSANIFAQNNLSVDFEKRNCEDCETSFLIKDFTILKENQLFKKIEYPNRFAFYASVPDGKYSFHYVNIFGDTIKKVIILPDKEETFNWSQVTLYVDQLQDSIPKDLFLQRIKNGEKIDINFKFGGCFNSGKDSLTISKSKNNLYLLHKRKKRKLRPSEIQFLFQYENELRHLKEPGFSSTSNGINLMIYNSEKLYYVEPSIYWEGYSLLKKRLKLK